MMLNNIYSYFTIYGKMSHRIRQYIYYKLNKYYWSDWQGLRIVSHTLENKCKTVFDKVLKNLSHTLETSQESCWQSIKNTGLNLIFREERAFIVIAVYYFTIQV